MPALGIKVTMYMRESVTGWSESHYLHTETLINNALTPARALANARIKCLGNGAYFTGLRLSVAEGAKPRPSTLIALDPLKSVAYEYAASLTNGQATTNKDNNAEDQRSCIIIRLTSPNVLEKKALYLNAVPDGILQTNPRGPDLAANPVFAGNLDSYMALLCNGFWAFRGRLITGAANLTQNIVATSTAAAGPALLGVSTDQAGHLFAAGDTLQLSGFRMRRKAQKAPNGQFRIQSVVIDNVLVRRTYFLLNTETYTHADIVLPGTIRGVNYEAKTYFTWRAAQQSGRKRGRPLWLTRGRRSVVARV